VKSSPELASTPKHPPPLVAAPSAVNARGRVAALDGLRGIAVLLVVVLHYYVIVPGPQNSPLHDWLQHAGSLFFCGVDLFFVLSGYLIGGIIMDHRESRALLPAFYARRFFRIVPLYALLLATYFVCREIPGLNQTNRGLYFTSSVPDWSYLCFGQNIAMAWKRDIGAYWLGATWSLAVEEQFYLLAPLIIIRFARRPLIVGCALLIAVSPLLRMMALERAQNNLAAVFLLPTHADGLLWGVLCAAIVRSVPAMEWLRRQRAMLVAVISMLAAMMSYLSFRGFASDSREMAFYGYSVVNVFFATVLLHVISAPDSILARLLSFRPLTAIGLTSYFIYLFHTPIWYWLHWAILQRPPLHVSWIAGAVTCGAFLVTLFFSWGSWRWFEAPLLKIGHRFPYRK
jgi:peptidoglycan/LPS O-acetylase OafA/YrhL